MGDLEIEDLSEPLQYFVPGGEIAAIYHGR